MSSSYSVKKICYNIYYLIWEITNGNILQYILSLAISNKLEIKHVRNEVIIQRSFNNKMGLASEQLAIKIITS